MGQIRGVGASRAVAGGLAPPPATRPTRPARQTPTPTPATGATARREITHLRDLTPDPHNVREHTPANVGTLEEALKDVGAARSIVIDEDGVVLAGNATIEAAGNAGIERVRVVEADGNEIIAVRRTNLTPEQKTRLALYDNRTAELARWDYEALSKELQRMNAAGENLHRLGWSDDELAPLLNADWVAPPMAQLDDQPGVHLHHLTFNEEEWTTLNAAHERTGTDLPLVAWIVAVLGHGSPDGE